MHEIKSVSSWSVEIPPKGALDTWKQLFHWDRPIRGLNVYLLKVQSVPANFILFHAASTPWVLDDATQYVKDLSKRAKRRMLGWQLG